ncbi:MAG: alpha/beta hydrolase, partial [Rhodoferax sp.]|nr:alpha/beta hydrolase [Actinomycetota bacterium]
MTMALRTRVLCTLAAARRGPQVADLTAAQLQRNRRSTLPHWFPLDRVFGSVPSSVRISEDVATTRAGGVPVRVYRPASQPVTPPLVMFVHGGGWVQGNVRSYDALCAQVAQRVGAVVVSVDYRLAPEHVFPAGLHDAYDATLWAVEHAGALGADAARLAVMGDSAGGNLAAAITLLARDGAGPRIAAQVLFYPATDATLSSPSIQHNANAPILSRADVHGFLGHYRGDADVPDPRLSPLHATDHAGLPPALIQTAELDPLRDDGARYADALRAAGVSVRRTDYPRV